MRLALLAVLACPLLAQQKPSVSGDFDYFLLAMSWSPEHCASPAGASDRVQCGGPRRFGFVIHGLWPQYERGWPQDCPSAEQLSQSVIDSALPVMPSVKLIRHEWSKHGTCSGWPSRTYFAKAREAFESIKLPPRFANPTSQVMVAPAKARQEILAANPQLKANGISVNCRGRFFQELRVCFDRNLKPRPCGSGVRDTCRVPEMIVRPLR